MRSDPAYVGLLGHVRGWSRRRLALNVASAVLAGALLAFAGHHFAATGWPLAGANPRLVGAAAALFLLAYALKACGWQRLFVPAERPGSLVLAAAAGAASVSGAALPGRVDDAVRVAVVRRHPGCRASVGTLCLSLFMLGLIDAVALVPFASAAALTSEAPLLVRIGLGIVAAAGFGAALVVLLLPHLSRSGRLTRFRVVAWLAERATCSREARRAAALVLLSWLVRAAGIFLLLGALGVGLSVTLAIGFLCAAAASGAIPVAPAGAATQAGAGAGLLVASGIATADAVAFAVAAQVLVILVGAAVVVFSLAWAGGRRLAAGRLVVA